MTTPRRLSTIAILAAAAALLSAGIAAAKGPDSLRIEGPGLAEPRVVAPIYTDPPNADWQRLQDLMQATKVMSMGSTNPCGTPGGSCREPAAPTGDLGSRYTLTWTNSGLADPWAVQDVYPYAAGGPAVHDREVGWQSGPIEGWFRADPALLTVWADIGLPTRSAADAQTAPPAPAIAPAEATRSAGSERASAARVWPWLIGAVALAGATGTMIRKWTRQARS